MLAFLRILKFAFQDIGRNISLTFMTVLILVLMLLSMNTLVIVRALTNHAVVTIKEQIDVSVFFDHEVTDEEVTEVQAYIESFPEVVGVTYKDRDTVLAEFKRTHKDNPEILASIDELGVNPLGPTMIVKTRQPEDYQKIITALTVPEYESLIEAKTFADTQKAIDKVTLITGQVERAVLILSAFFAVISFFVIFNTIRVAIYTQRREISIKKLVGATNWFVRGPYVVESVVFSLVSTGMTMGIVLWSVRFFDPYIAVVLGESGFLTNYFTSNILTIAGIQFVGVLFMTIVTSGLAMRRYLRT